jgi:hypothetical protein
MSTQVLRERKRPSVVVLIVAAVVAAAVLVIAAQATSLVSSGTGSPRQASYFIPSFSPAFSNVGHIPADCRPKYGCQGGGPDTSQP